MIEKTITLREIAPSKGYVLTNGREYADYPIYLSVNDSAENWYEITDAEYAEIMEKLEQQTEEELL